MNLYEEYIENMIQLARDAASDSRYDEAKNLLEGALMEEPGYAKVHAKLGDLYCYDLENPELAARHYELAIRFYPAYMEIYRDLVTIYLDQHEYSKLKSLLRSAVGAKGIDQVFVFEKLGMAEEAQGNYKAAVECYKNGMLESLSNQDTAELKKHIKRNRYKRLRIGKRRTVRV